MYYSQDYCQNNPGALKIIYLLQSMTSIGVIIINVLTVISICFQSSFKSGCLLIFPDHLFTKCWNNKSLYYAKNYSSIITSPSLYMIETSVVTC